jgi:hypothetical protein
MTYSFHPEAHFDFQGFKPPLLTYAFGSTELGRERI